MLNKSAFSLIEVIVSLALFSFVITAVVTLSIQMATTQRQIQAQLFLVQTAQTTLENMSRNLRFGYNYSGSEKNIFDGKIVLKSASTSAVASSSGAYSQILFNVANSPFVLFEAQGGNPTSYADQNSYCMEKGQLYRITDFVEETGSTDAIKYWSARCDSGFPMLPDEVEVESLSFDIFGDDSQNPKYPMTRIRMKIKHEEAGSLEIQTTVTQRLVTYF